MLNHATPEVIFENQDVLVVLKAAGVVVHPGYQHPDGTLWNSLVPMFQARGLDERPHLLHRLDRDTSGLLCVPKHPASHRFLERALRQGRFVKQYLALVHGTIADPQLIDSPLARNPHDRRLVIVSADGKVARTRIRPLRRLAGCTLLRVQLETGRTHQIRVHLQSIGHPVVGDQVYAPLPPLLPRLFLHADRLSFPNRIGSGMISCRSPLSDDLRYELAQIMRGYSTSCNPIGADPA